jgi:hypothetical protein
MKDQLFTDLPQRMEEAYPEMENEMLIELKQKDNEYAKLHERFYTLQEQHPFLLEVLEGNGSVTMTAEEHEIFLKYLALYRKMDEKERIHIYFRGTRTRWLI